MDYTRGDGGLESSMHSLTKQRAGPGSRPAQRTSSSLLCIKVSLGREALLSSKTGIFYVSACGFLGRHSNNDNEIDITDLPLHLHITESLRLFSHPCWLSLDTQVRSRAVFSISFVSTLLPGLVSKLSRPLGGRSLLPLLFGGRRREAWCSCPSLVLSSLFVLPPLLP